MDKIENKVLDKYKNLVSQMLGAIINRLKVIKNIMGIFSSYISFTFSSDFSFQTFAIVVIFF